MHAAAQGCLQGPAIGEVLVLFTGAGERDGLTARTARISQRGASSICVSRTGVSTYVRRTILEIYCQLFVFSVN
jgi:hypothetical protein